MENNNKSIVQEWLQFTEMDYNTAIYLYENMYPKPLEIICYHSQQAIEKGLKGFLISKEVKFLKTHDLSVLLEQVQEFAAVPEEIYDCCEQLNPYGVKIRYPQELYIEESHVKKAIDSMKLAYNWMVPQIIV